MKKDAWNWNQKVCQDLSEVMIMNDQVIGKAIHAAMAIDYCRKEST